MKRRICLITESLDRRRGGAESHLADLAQSFADAGHPIRALLRRPGVNPPSVEAEVVPTWIGPGSLREWAFGRAVQRRLAGTSDMVFSTLPLVIPAVTHYFSPSGLYRAGFEAERASFDPGLQQRFYRLGNRLNLQRQRRMAAQEKLLGRNPPLKVLTLSAAARDQIRNLSPVANVTTIPPGVDLTQFYSGQAASQRAEKLHLLFVGHNFRLKGLHCLLRALSSAVKRGLQAELTVAGGGASGEFKALAASLGLASQVHFLGPVSAGEMGERYRTSDALIHPTFADHCSLVVLEALASGLPVITTRQNGAAELTESGRHGFIIDDPRNLEALATALLCLQDLPKLAEMREAAVALRTQLDFADHARRVLAWLTGD